MYQILNCTTKQAPALRMIKDDFFGAPVYFTPINKPPSPALLRLVALDDVSLDFQHGYKQSAQNSMVYKMLNTSGSKAKCLELKKVYDDAYNKEYDESIAQGFPTH